MEVSDSETAQPIPLNHSFPPFTQQSDSDVTLNFSSEKSADFQFLDPPSPQIQSLPKHTQPQTPSSTILTSEPLSSTPLVQEPSSPYPSYLANTSTEIIFYDPKPHNFLECINMFGLSAKKRAAALMASTSVQPDSIKA